jgi:hypothetical protein
MKILLTSFGITDATSEESEKTSIFYRMPPVSMHEVGSMFMPDYAALLLCDQIIFDESSFDALEEKPHWSYSAVSNAIKALRTEGFIELVNFKNILRDNKILLEKMVEHDLKMIDQWIEPLKDSLDLWNNFARFAFDRIREENVEYWSEIRRDLDEAYSAVWQYPAATLLHEANGSVATVSMMVKEALHSSQKRKKRKYRDALRQVLKSYLSYVNANIIISNQLGVGFHDWMDFLPFYQHKFLSVGQEDIKTEQHIKESHKLFKVSFPEFAISDTTSLIKALEDKRIVSLRNLVQDAVDGKATFDEAFAKNVLREVLDIERRARRYRNITSYLTMPIGFIPLIGTPAQKILEEAVSIPLEGKLTKPHQWFYLLSDIANKSTGEDEGE